MDPPVIATKLDLEDSGTENLKDSSKLATNYTIQPDIVEQGNDVQQLGVHTSDT